MIDASEQPLETPVLTPIVAARLLAKGLHASANKSTSKAMNPHDSPSPAAEVTITHDSSDDTENDGSKTTADRQSDGTEASSSHQSFVSCQDTGLAISFPNGSPWPMKGKISKPVVESHDPESPGEAVKDKHRRSSLLTAPTSKYNRRSLGETKVVTPAGHIASELSADSPTPQAHSSSSPETERPHSPSPASFSRPRPSRIPSLANKSSASSLRSLRSLRSPHTASRLPLSTASRATVVTVRARHSFEKAPGTKVVLSAEGNPETPLNNNANKKRHYRPLRRVDTRLSIASVESIGTSVLATDDSPLASMRRAAPPSRSPFTAPLPTIQSQAILPVADNGKPARDSLDLFDDGTIIQSVEAPEFSGEVVIYKNDHEDRSGGSVDSDSKAKGEVSSDSATTLVTHGSVRHDHTLSLLEGGGTRPKTSVTKSTARAMFPKSMVDPRATNKQGQAAPNHPPNGEASTGNSSESETTLQASTNDSDMLDSQPSMSRWSLSTVSQVSPALDSPHGKRRLTPGKRFGTPLRLASNTPKDGEERASSSLRSRIPSLTRNGRPFSPFPTAISSSPMFGRRSRDAGDEDQNHVDHDELPPTSTNLKALKVLHGNDRGRISAASMRDSAGTVTTVTAKNVRPAQRERSRGRLVLNKINDLFSGKRLRGAKGGPHSTASPPLPLPPVPDNSRYSLVPRSLPDPEIQNPRPAPKPATSSRRGLLSVPHRTEGSRPSPHPSRTSSLAARDDINTNRTAPDHNHRPTTTSGAAPGSSPRLATSTSATPSGATALAVRLAAQARQTSTSAGTRDRLLMLAQVLSASVLQAKEAQISMETAAAAARSAQLSYDMTMQGVDMTVKVAAKVAAAFEGRRSGRGG